VLLATMLLKPTAVGSMLAALPFYAVEALGGTHTSVTVAFVSFVLAMMAGMPLWTAVARRAGKWAALRLAVALLGVVALGLLAPSPSSAWLVHVLFALAGLAYGGAQLLPFAILPDVVDTDAAGNEGSLSGLLTAAEKAGMALGALVCGVTLAAGARAAIAVAPGVLLGLCLAVLAARRP
jgi:GPH family glycoside/pentoside/hexuronide:cation symporter